MVTPYEHYSAPNMPKEASIPVMAFIGFDRDSYILRDYRLP
jgi:hypothetical protein